MAFCCVCEIAAISTALCQSVEAGRQTTLRAGRKLNRVPIIIHDKEALCGGQIGLSRVVRSANKPAPVRTSRKDRQCPGRAPSGAVLPLLAHTAHFRCPSNAAPRATRINGASGRISTSLTVRHDTLLDLAHLDFDLDRTSQENTDFPVRPSEGLRFRPEPSACRAVLK